MGQKTNPIGNRIGIIRTWDSRWFLKKGYSNQLLEDIRVRKLIKSKLYHAGVARIEIERPGQKLKVIIHSARPGIIIGKKGAEVDVSVHPQTGAVTIRPGVRYFEDGKVTPRFRKLAEDLLERRAQAYRELAK